MASINNAVLLFAVSLLFNQAESSPLSRRYIEYCYSDSDCEQKQKEIDTRNIAIGCTIGGLALLSILFSCCLCYRRRRARENAQAAYMGGWHNQNQAAQQLSSYEASKRQQEGFAPQQEMYPMQQQQGTYYSRYTTVTQSPAQGSPGDMRIETASGQGWVQQPQASYGGKS